MIGRRKQEKGREQNPDLTDTNIYKGNQYNIVKPIMPQRFLRTKHAITLWIKLGKHYAIHLKGGIFISSVWSMRRSSRCCNVWSMKLRLQLEK